MPRLPKGIYKRIYQTKRGTVTRYYGAVWDPRTKKLHTTSICPTAAEARSLHDKLTERIKRGELVPKVKTLLTVNEFIELYRNQLQKRVNLGKIKPSTVGSSIYMLRASIGKIYGKMELRRLTSDHMEQLQDDLLSMGRAHTYAHSILARCGTAFKWAVKKRYMAFNIVESVEKAEYIPRPSYVPTVLELQRLQDIADNRSRAVIGLAALAGLRRGEIFGLKVTDVNFADHRLNIDKQYYTGHITTPKTRSSIRAVVLLPELEQILRAWIEKRGLMENPWLFPGKFMKPYSPKGWEGRYFRSLLKQLDMEFTLHSLRAFFSSNMHNLGLRTREINRLMGHRTLDMTLYYDRENKDTIDKIVQETRGLKVFKDVYFSEDFSENKTK